MVPLIGIYLTVVMSLTSMSIILTVVVLQLHHAGQFAPIIPHNFYDFMTKKVAKFIGMSKTVSRYEANRSIIDKKKRNSSVNNPIKNNHLLEDIENDLNSMKYDFKKANDDELADSGGFCNYLCCCKPNKDNVKMYGNSIRKHKPKLGDGNQIGNHIGTHIGNNHHYHQHIKNEKLLIDNNISNDCFYNSEDHIYYDNSKPNHDIKNQKKIKISITKNNEQILDMFSKSNGIKNCLNNHNSNGNLLASKSVQLKSNKSTPSDENEFKQTSSLPMTPSMKCKCKCKCEDFGEIADHLLPNPNHNHHHHHHHYYYNNKAAQNYKKDYVESIEVISQNLKAYMEKQNLENLRANLQNEWKLVALIVDRVLFWAFTILTFFSTIVLLIVVPVLKNRSIVKPINNDD